MIRKTMILFLTLILAAGCAPGAPLANPTTELHAASVQTATAAPTPLPTAPARDDSNECDQPFYPVSDGAAWEYSLSTGINSTYTMAVDENDAFTLIIQGDDSAFKVEGKCTPEGIVLMNTPGAATTVSSDQGSAAVSTVEVEGVTLPKDIKINDTWSQTIHVQSGDTSSVIQTNYTALGFENITVPAGEFYTLKIEQSGYVEIFGQKVQMHGYQWLAEGVGTVKSAMDDAPTAELVSYDIPD